jgi:prepilin-type N-terminal cleavage/methylation domain-containing protein
MTRRRGFTLTEILIAVVLLGIVGLGISRLLVSQTRFFARATGARDARSVTRNALNIVRDEMRMIEPRGITAATTTSITVNVPYTMGIYCSSSTATFVPVDSLIRTTAVFRGYAYRDTALNASYTYVGSTTAPTAGTASNCTGTPGITPVTGGQTLALSPAFPTLAPGAPVFLYQTIRYRLAASTLVPGRTALWRDVTGGLSEEVAVPFQNTAIFRFYVSGGTTSQATVPGTLNTITGIELVLVGESERNSPGTSTPESKTVRLSIFFRNAVY